MPTVCTVDIDCGGSGFDSTNLGNQLFLSGLGVQGSVKSVALVAIVHGIS